MTTTSPADPSVQSRAAVAVLLSLSLCHLLNDTIQSLLPAIYPVLQENYALSFTQIGVLHFAFQVTASLLQPAVGMAGDRRQRVRLLPAGMAASLAGLVVLAFADSFPVLVLSAVMIGLGSAIFHPDASRIARAASGGRYGYAQSVFQVGGNVGTALGPLLAAYVVLPLGQPSIAWFSALALLGMLVLWNVGTWAREHQRARAAAGHAPSHGAPLPRRQVIAIMTVLALLIFSKFAYIACLTSFYTFFLIERFGVSIQASQLLLFLFLAASALGTLVGGPIGDRIGRNAVIWVSILGALPFALLLPHVGLAWTAVLSVVIGFLTASAFPAIIVYAQALAPDRIGLISGIFFGFAFGIAGVAAAGLGVLADRYGMDWVFQVCALLPAVGILAVFLPPEGRLRRR